MPTATDAAQSMVDAGSVGAVAAVLRDGELEAAACGVADLETGEPLTTAHRFRIGSISKTYTAALLLLLAEDGLLGLDDLALEYVDGLDPRITVRHLLSHRSGLFDSITDGDIAERNFFGEPYTCDPRAHLAVAPRYPLRFEPGTRAQYSNTNFQTLGLIAERVAGSSLGSLLEHRVFRPCGLERTTFAPVPGIEDGLARGYALPGGCFPTGAGPRDATLYLHGAWADGSIVADAADALRFYERLLSGGLVSATSRAAMLTEHGYDEERHRTHGLGIFGRETRCGMSWGHGGMNPAYISGIRATADGSRIALVTLNSQGPRLPLASLKAVETLFCA